MRLHYSISLDLSQNMLNSSLQHEGSWKIKNLHILPEWWSDWHLFHTIVITFVIRKFHFVQTRDQVPSDRFVQQGNTHISISIVSYLSILTLSTKTSEIVTTRSISISNIHVLASLFYQDYRSREKFSDHTFNFISLITDLWNT